MSLEFFERANHWQMWFERGAFCYKTELEVWNYNTSLLFFEDRLKFVQGKDYPCLGDIRRMRYWTKDSKKLSVHPEYVIHYNAIALYIDNPVQEIIGTFFLKFYNPPLPVKLFTDREKAFQWLKDFISQEEMKKYG